MGFKRRDVLKAFSLASFKIIFGSGKSLAMGKSEKNEKMFIYPRRTLGSTGEKVSVIAFGGIVVKDADPAHASKVVAEAVGRGINYFDVAPTYGDAEVKLGPALKPFRDKCFLACKTMERDRDGARKELEQSLKNLETDHFDLYQLHAITDVEKDVEAAFAKGGAMETFHEAKKEGKIKYMGFSAHSPEAALRAMELYDFDTAMYPINFACHFNNGFDDEVVATAKKKKMGIIALKAMAKEQRTADYKGYEKCWYEPLTDAETAQKAISWTLSQGAHVAIPPGEEELFRIGMNVGPDCLSISENEVNDLKALAKDCRALFG